MVLSFKGYESTYNFEIKEETALGNGCFFCAMKKAAVNGLLWDFFMSGSWWKNEGVRKKIL